MIWPVNGPLTSPFCESRSWESCHPGIDIAVPTGTPIRAALSGKVVLLQGEGASGGYGNFTCIQHGGALSTCYAHQVRFGTSMGAQVSKGQVIGYVGSTGRSTGPHLHFETRINGSVVIAYELSIRRDAARDQRLRPDDPIVRALPRLGVPGRGLDGRQAPEGAGPQPRLRLRDGLRGADRRDRRRQAVVPRRERRPAVQRHRPDLLRRPARRRARRLRLGQVQGPARPRARRRRRALAGRRLRDRADRLPARRRRRLRLRLGRPVGDVLSQRHGADRHARAPDADLRDHRHGRLRAAAVALAQPLVAGHAERHLPDRHGPGALAGRVRAPQRRRLHRAHAAPARLGGDDPRGRGVAGSCTSAGRRPHPPRAPPSMPAPCCTPTPRGCRRPAVDRRL